MESSQASSRNLPARNVTEETIVEAYATFILFANPYYPSNANTTELKRTFGNVPRSDRKEFSPFVLWRLVRQLELGEIKTWIQLALIMGVEPPTVENRASVQKVQQYTVRLKVGHSSN